jgi:hypothetical protein
MRRVVRFSWDTRRQLARAVLKEAYEYAYYLRILRKLITDLELIETGLGGGGPALSESNRAKAYRTNRSREVDSVHGAAR